MSKAQKITLAVAAVVIIAMLIIAGVTGGAMSEVSCIDCHSTGLVDGEACETCGGTAKFAVTSGHLFLPLLQSVLH